MRPYKTKNNSWDAKLQNVCSSTCCIIIAHWFWRLSLKRNPWKGSFIFLFSSSVISKPFFLFIFFSCALFFHKLSVTICHSLVKKDSVRHPNVIRRQTDLVDPAMFRFVPLQCWIKPGLWKTKSANIPNRLDYRQRSSAQMYPACIRYWNTTQC